MKIHDTGCPICGEDNADWMLLAQLGHVMDDHSWHERWRLYRQTRQHIKDLLIFRKYGTSPPVLVESPSDSEGGHAPPA